MAAGFNIQNAPPTQNLPFANDPTFIQLYNSIVGNTGPGGQTWTAANTTNTLNQYATDFTQQFQNAVGRPPTAAEISQFFQQAVSPVGATQAGFSGTDPNQVASQYVPQAFQQQIQQHQQAQLPGQVSSLINTLQPAFQQGMNAFTQGPGMQQLEGQMNNLGLLDSGAFNSALATETAGIGGKILNNAIQGFAIPQFGGTQSPTLQELSGFGRQAGNTMAGNNQNLFDFNLQAGLGQQLASEMQPSGFQTGIGEASSLLQGLGGAGAGAGLLAQGTSYICQQLIKEGLATQADLDALHYKVMPAVWKKGRAFWLYATRGKELVDIANKKGVDWSKWRVWFIDKPLSCHNAIECANEYAWAFYSLCSHVQAEHLWDKRAMRVSLLDSIPFLPRLIFYGPYRRTLMKVLRMKMMFLYDMPRSASHVR